MSMNKEKMELDKAEIDQQLTHQRNIRAIHRKTLNALEERAALKGIDVPIDLMNQIDWVKLQIKEAEQEINRLEAQAVEQDFSLAEAEFRHVLANAWDNSRGLPSTVGKTMIELTRIKLHITQGRARELEEEIRESIANDIATSMTWFDETASDAFKDFQEWLAPWNDSVWDHVTFKRDLPTLWRLFATSPKNAIDFIMEVSSTPFAIEFKKIVVPLVIFAGDYYTTDALEKHKDRLVMPQ